MKKFLRLRLVLAGFFFLLMIGGITFISGPSFNLPAFSKHFKSDTDTITQPENYSEESSHLYYGFWDHQEDLEFVNVGKSKSKSIGFIVDQGIPGIAIIEGFSEDRGEIRNRLKDNRSFITKYKSGTENLFTILTDEPFSEGKDAQIMERMIADAKEIIGEPYEFAFTFKELAFRDNRQLPQNADWIGINFYPFRHKGGVRSKEEFMNRFEYVYQRAKEKAPNSKIFIVGQAFHGGKWSQPPAEAPFWYLEFVQSHDIDALLWWKWKSSSTWDGAEDMPEFLENARKVYQLIPARSE